jgi:hypothetical protein
MSKNIIEGTRLVYIIYRSRDYCVTYGRERCMNLGCHVRGDQTTWRVPSSLHTPELEKGQQIAHLALVCFPLMYPYAATIEHLIHGGIRYVVTNAYSSKYEAHVYIYGWIVELTVSLR